MTPASFLLCFPTADSEALRSPPTSRFPHHDWLEPRAFSLNHFFSGVWPWQWGKYLVHLMASAEQMGDIVDLQEMGLGRGCSGRRRCVPKSNYGTLTAPSFSLLLNICGVLSHHAFLSWYAALIGGHLIMDRDLQNDKTKWTSSTTKKYQRVTYLWYFFVVTRNWQKGWSLYICDREFCKLEIA